MIYIPRSKGRDDLRLHRSRGELSHVMDAIASVLEFVGTRAALAEIRRHFCYKSACPLRFTRGAAT